MTLRCDTEGCRNRRAEDMSSFKDNIDLFQIKGWLVMRSGGEWKHICPTCSPNSTEEQKAEFQVKIDTFKKYGLNA
jgi:hypothetical protein